MSSPRTLRIAVAGIAAAALFSLAAISAPALAASSSGANSSGANSNSASFSAHSVKAAPGKNAEVTIYLTRHGETWLNTTHRMQGWSDSPLTESGELDAQHLGAGLAEAGVKFKSAYSADMVRHYETISLALDELSYKGEPVRDKGLREVAFGKFEGETQAATFKAVTPYLTGGDMDAFLNAIVKANEGSGVTAETVDQLTARAMASLNTIAAAQAKQGGGNVLVVSSGITIVAVLDAMGADTSTLTEGIDNAAVSKLTYKNGAWTVVTMNDSSYVEAGAN